MNVSDDAPTWIAAISAVFSAIAATAAATGTYFQLRAIKEQTRASLFEEKFQAYMSFRDAVRSAYLHGGTLNDVQLAQVSADKLKFLFSTHVTTEVEIILKQATTVVTEREAADVIGKREGGPHYDAMSLAAKQLRVSLKHLDNVFDPELSHAPP